MNLGLAHKTQFWNLLGVFSTSTPVPFRGEYPPPGFELYHLIKFWGSLPAAAFFSDGCQQVVHFLHHWGVVWLKLARKSSFQEKRNLAIEIC